MIVSLSQKGKNDKNDKNCRCSQAGGMVLHKKKGLLGDALCLTTSHLLFLGTINLCS